MKKNLPFLSIFIVTLCFALNFFFSFALVFGSEGNRGINFPEDEGAHSGVKNLEWWYTAMRVKGQTTGHEYAIMISHFNNRFRFFSIADLTEDDFLNDTGWGALKVAKNSLNLQHKINGQWDTLKALDRDQKLYSLSAYGKAIGMEGVLENLKPPLFVGLDGYVPVGNSGHSYYYSLSRMKAQGSLEFKGKKEKFIGEAWLDHQWGPFFVSPISFGDLLESYEWFCVQLDNGVDIMISQIFNQKGVVPWDKKHAFVHIHDQEGKTKMFQDAEFEFERLAFMPHERKPGRQISSLWRLKVEKEQLDLLITPHGHHDHYIDFPFNGDFIEGATYAEGTYKDHYVQGKGFAELIKTF